MAANHTIRVHYRNVMSDAIGEEGLSPAELDAMGERIGRVVGTVESERRDGGHRYRDLPYQADTLAAVKAAARPHRKAKNLVVLGIGGSALGNIALQSALNSPVYNLLPTAKRKGPRLFVLDNIDPVLVRSVLDLIGPELAQTCVNVISKSGETAETASQFLIVRDLLRRRLGADQARERFVVTTDPEKGTLRDIVDAEGYASLPVPPGVGGRFSVLSAVGLFSAAVCGIKVDRLLAGAASMDKPVGRTDLRKNPAAMLAAVLYLFYQRGKRLHVMLPYSNQLKDLADWYRQLWAESLGKREALDGREVFVGPTPIKALGATDQHSQVQLYREGPNDKVIVFVEVESFDRPMPIPSRGCPAEVLEYLGGADLGELLVREKQATEHALVASRRPCLTIRLPAITPETVGQFIYLWEAATTIAGELFGVNAYDQPAVELGKVGTFALMGRSGYQKDAADIRRTSRIDRTYLV